MELGQLQELGICWEAAGRAVARMRSPLELVNGSIGPSREDSSVVRVKIYDFPEGCKSVTVPQEYMRHR